MIQNYKAVLKQQNMITNKMKLYMKAHNDSLPSSHADKTIFDWIIGPYIGFHAFKKSYMHHSSIATTSYSGHHKPQEHSLVMLEVPEQKFSPAPPPPVVVSVHIHWQKLIAQAEWQESTILCNTKIPNFALSLATFALLTRWLLLDKIIITTWAPNYQAT